VLLALPVLKVSKGMLVSGSAPQAANSSFKERLLQRGIGEFNFGFLVGFRAGRLCLHLIPRISCIK
jgi:hypothetical protein